jgi:hypothetical protein
MMNAATERNRYLAFAAFAALIVWVMAYANRLTFPFPWNDEATLFLAAQWWAEHLAFNPSTLHAPNGIYWVPDGFTVIIGLCLRLFGNTIDVARAVCECFVTAGVFLFALAFRSISGTWKIGALTTLFLLTPPIVFAANMMRFEAPLCLLFALVLILHERGYRLAAGSLLFGSLLIHPAFGLPAFGYALTAWAAPEKYPAKRSQTIVGWVTLALIAGAIAAEAVHVMHHLDLFHFQMGVQSANWKLRVIPYKKFRKPQEIILLLATLATALVVARCARRRQWNKVREILPIAALALGVMLYSNIGAEMAYDLWTLSIGPACIFCLIAKTLYDEKLLDTSTAAQEHSTAMHA